MLSSALFDTVVTMTDSMETSEENVDTTDALEIISKTSTPQQTGSPLSLPRLVALTDEEGMPTDDARTREFPSLRNSQVLDDILGEAPTGAVSDQTGLQHIDHTEQFKPHPIELNVPEIADLKTSEALPQLHSHAEKTLRANAPLPQEPFSAFPEFPESAMPAGANIPAGQDGYIEPELNTAEFTRPSDADTETAEFERAHATRPRHAQQSALDDPYFGMSEETIEHMKAAENISAGFENAPTAEEIDPDAPTAEIPIQRKK